MRSPKVNYFLVGGFVLAMGVTFVLVMAALAGRTGATERYYTHYDNVLGVVPGTQLLYEGLRVGQVESIEPSGDAAGKRYRVELSVKEGLRIPEDSVAWIVEPSLLAAIAIDIEAGDSDAFLQPGDDIEGRDLESLFTAVGTLAGQVETIVEHDIRPLLERVAEASPRILENLEFVTNDLAAVSGRVSTLVSDENVGQIDGMIGDLAATARNLDALTHTLEDSLARVDQMVESVDRVVSGNTDEVDRMLADLAHTLDSVARHVDAINANLESTTHNMNEFSRQLRQNPAVLIRGNDAEGDAP